MGLGFRVQDSGSRGLGCRVHGRLAICYSALVRKVWLKEGLIVGSWEVKMHSLFRGDLRHNDNLSWAMVSTSISSNCHVTSIKT